MESEVVKLVKRAVIDYLGGRKEEFERLANMAMLINKEICCRECGRELVHCKFGHKGHKEKGYFCTACGEVQDINGKIRRMGRKVKNVC